MLPFLKWPGGKRWFISNYAHFLPSNYERYIEPFLGGGSVFFHLEPRAALLSDTNEELVATYNCIRKDWQRVTERLCEHQEKHGSAHYYAVRDNMPSDPVDRAARLIYLNRTCFNGIYRVNLKGKFNVPKGTKDTVVFASDDFERVARILMNTELRVGDFQVAVDEARRGDFIFADPPYTVRHNLNGFTKYNEKLFSWEDQLRLANALSLAKDRGAMILVTNANHSSVRDLYKNYGFDFRVVTRFSSISGKPESRKQFEELVVHANLSLGEEE